MGLEMSTARARLHLTHRTRHGDCAFLIAVLALGHFFTYIY